MENYPGQTPLPGTARPSRFRPLMSLVLMGHTLRPIQEDPALTITWAANRIQTQFPIPAENCVSRAKEGLAQELIHWPVTQGHLTSS